MAWMQADTELTASSDILLRERADGWRAEPGIAEQAAKINGSILKRSLDILGASFAILFFLPLLVAVAVLIKIDSGGPVFFRQERYGVGRKTFRIWKFRTMRVLEASGPFRQAVEGDDRVTPIGRFLRRTSIDELPQLFNVLKGEMSLVGPRPHALSMDDDYAALLPNYADRHLVKPGMTGLAQIAGYRGPTPILALIAARLRFDRVYIARWSVLYDLKIIALTPIRLFGSHVF
jgi:lipopolysaccharide/colanic/teichoic acid biosynthesis glycosyltransferase